LFWNVLNEKVDERLFSPIFSLAQIRALTGQPAHLLRLAHDRVRLKDEQLILKCRRNPARRKRYALDKGKTVISISSQDVGVLMDRFHYTGFAQEVIFGAGAIAQLGEAADRFHWRRLMLCTTGSLRRGGEVTSVQAALGKRLSTIYEPVMPHVPDYQVDEALARAVENEIDALIGMGGGSPIGMAKAVSLALEEKRTGQPARAAFPTDQPRVPVVAIPTTYAGSEMTPVYGITYHSESSSRKVTVADPKVTPKLTIYDPLLTLKLSPEMTASTGINALAHCVEGVYSIRRNPLSTAAALGGARRIASALPHCYARGDDLEARTEYGTAADVPLSCVPRDGLWRSYLGYAVGTGCQKSPDG
jgi:alcohol dehydrogenase YqhD (iron-dependent ADH family)